MLVSFARLAYGLALPAMCEELGLSYAPAVNLGTLTALRNLGLVMTGLFATILVVSAETVDARQAARAGKI